MFGRQQLPSVTVHDAPQDAHFLDVREPDEWRAGRIDGAQHIELMTLPQRLDEIPTDTQVVVVCRVGGRSAQATAFLQQAGIDAVNLDGGMIAWDAAGRPIVGDVEQPFVL
jgi:rhodanese-related sulfurtransferase